ncbi:hypothetical protein BJ170DRAFT_585983 [Xylariales sp. AK1849]|nr:hypothetical protein BJ170DRAFT_585983 [Xylariales sp. AK1849]
MGAPNPLGFTPFVVTFWITLVYLAILIPLVLLHESVPPVPENVSHQNTKHTAYSGINVDEAWSDLDRITRAYHPYSSQENGAVRTWLLDRLDHIVRANGANESIVNVFDDDASNARVVHEERLPRTLEGSQRPKRFSGTYFEGSNIIVYIRGKDDPPGKWYDDGGLRTDKVIGKGGVLVNAHFDSVPTGYGATDDGMAVVSVMQLVKYFTTPGNQPQRGIVALLNNNEEEGLLGAYAFGAHPLMPFCHVFLNLEGAGAGGKPILFRTTDAEVTNAYKGAPNPLGTVVFKDGWDLHVIRSSTDFDVFNKTYGMRGLDVAFYRPRSRYHTNQDDARHASKASLWHMLSVSLHTMKRLSGDTGDTFIGNRQTGERKKVSNGIGSDGVWFDLVGKTFVLFGLRTLFAWSLVLLIATPLVLMLLTYLLIRQDKYYFFSGSKSAYKGSDLEPVTLGGRKGMLRFPFALAVASASVFGTALLVKKINPFAIYTYEYATWVMMISLFFFVFWAIMRGANFARPSALHRGYAIVWLFTITWAILVAVTVAEDRLHVAAGYSFVFLHSAVFLSAVISLCELFALSTKTTFAQTIHDDPSAQHHVNDDNDHVATVSQIDNHDTPGAGVDVVGEEAAHEEPSETSPLIGASPSQNNQTTFGTIYRRSIAAITDKKIPGDDFRHKPFGDEQLWSGKLPGWLWILQFLLLGPLSIILFSQMGLILVAALKETGADGGVTLFPYLTAAVFSIAILLPVTPFIHRVTHHIPLLLLAVFIATLAFNLVVFPFSATSRYKIFFVQRVDLDSGHGVVQYTGAEQYVRPALAQLPSAMGKKITCDSIGSTHLATCSYDVSDELMPRVSSQLKRDVGDWISFNTTRISNSTDAQFWIDALNTKTCGMRFTEPISSFQLLGGGVNSVHFDPDKMPEDAGLHSIQLYRRDWKKPWQVNVEWPKDAKGIASKFEVEVFCKWNDANNGAIPAVDEVLQYAPDWVAITSSGSDGLVIGSKTTKV